MTNESDDGMVYLSSLYATRNLCAWYRPPFAISVQKSNHVISLVDRASGWNAGACLGIAGGIMCAVLPMWQGPNLALPPNGQMEAVFMSLFGLILVVCCIIVLVRMRYVGNACAVDVAMQTVTITRRRLFGAKRVHGALSDTNIYISSCKLNFVMSHVLPWQGTCARIVLNGLPMIIVVDNNEKVVHEYVNALLARIPQISAPIVIDSVVHGWCTR